MMGFLTFFFVFVFPLMQLFSSLEKKVKFCIKAKLKYVSCHN